jgi:hypothetical protein
LAQRFGGRISLRYLAEIWRALGLIPHSAEGWVFDSNYQLVAEERSTYYYGVPFAHLTAISQSEVEGLPPFHKTVITNYLGLYPQLSLPLKLYKLAVSHPDYRYPSSLPRNERADLVDFYKTEALEVTLTSQSLSLQLPLDSDRLETGEHPQQQRTIWQKLFGCRQWSRSTSLQEWLARVIRFNSWVVLVNIILAGVILLFWPSLINVIALSLYLLIGSVFLLKESLMANIRGLVIDQDGNPVQNVLVRLIDEAGSLTTATLSNHRGRFGFYARRGRYQLTAVRPNHPSPVLQPKSNRLEINGWQEQHRLVIDC